MLKLSAAFSTLSVDENKLKNTKTKRKVSHSSLPNISTSGVIFKPPSSPVRNYSSCVFVEDEPETNDQPIDYSQKYSETSTNNAYNVVKSYNSSFNMYAETDLDQPTDYSLRYAEDDIDGEEKIIVKTEATEFVQDTIKTYCTEDTPYETPFNFSNATSMSDLRIDSNQKTEQKVQEKPSQVNKTEFSSGLMSPEKPVHYCEEGTPGLFSRVGSYGSLNSILVDTKLKKEENKVKQSNSETKNVKFEKVVNYAEETPLMFSRSSSLASLDSIEQHSIHDDRSSVVSDFSRITSGLISPSDLPDSPTQTVPPSPKTRKKNNLFSSLNKKIDNTQSSAINNSVFEDNIKHFKTESTPIQFSSATSLSNLTIDDLDKVEENKEEEATVEEDLNKNEENKKEELETNSVLFDEDDEADAELLAQCINAGMQNNRFVSPIKSPESIEENCVKNKENSIEILDENDEEEDKLLLASCIEMGMKYSRFTQKTKKKKALKSLKDKIKEENNNKMNDKEANDNEHQFSDEKTDNNNEENDDQAILAACIQMGMKCNRYTMSSNKIKEEQSINEEIENDKDILAACIKMGMKYNRFTKEKTAKLQESTNRLRKNLKKEEDQNGLVDVLSEEDNEDDQSILAACIQMGMKYNRYSNKKSCKKNLKKEKEQKGLMDILSEEENDEDQAILTACIQMGMKYNRYTQSEGKNKTVNVPQPVKY